MASTGRTKNDKLSVHTRCLTRLLTKVLGPEASGWVNQVVASIAPIGTCQGCHGDASTLKPSFINQRFDSWERIEVAVGSTRVRLSDNERRIVPSNRENLAAFDHTYDGRICSP